MSITNAVITRYLNENDKANRLFTTDPQFRFTVELTRSLLADVERLMQGNALPGDVQTRIIRGAVYGASGIDTPGRIAQATAVADVLADMVTEASAPSIILGEN